MKKIILNILAVLVLAVVTTKASAQTQPNYFVGKWDVLLKGLPQGDAHIKFNFADSVGHLKGFLIDTASQKQVPVTNIEQEKDKITVYFTAQGYDVYLLMTKKDDDHVTGSMMGMFDAEGVRAKSDK